MSGYIGSTPVPQATQHRESFTATEGQTSFATVGYTPQFVDVYLNGSHLSPADFTATNGSDVVLAVAASADDVCDIISYAAFEIASPVFTGSATFNEGSADADFRVESNGQTHMLFIDGGNNRVAIGTSTPAHALDVNGSLSSNGNENVMRIAGADASNAGGVTINSVFGDSAASRVTTFFSIDGQNQASPIAFGTGTTERMRIDATGDIILSGTSTADETNKSFNLQMLSHDTNQENLNILQVENEGAFNQISLGGGTSALNCATAIRFMTGNIDTTSGTERMRLSSAGHLYFSTGGTDPSGSQTGVRITGINGQNFFISANGGTSGYDQFAIFNGNGRVGSITTENSGTAFTTSSDHRLKENVVYNWDATTRLKQLKPARFNFIADADTTVDGFLAHEAATVVPEAVVGTHNEVDDDGVAVMLSLTTT